MSYFHQDSPPFNPQIPTASGRLHQQQQHIKHSSSGVTGSRTSRGRRDTETPASHGHTSIGRYTLSFLKSTQTLPLRGPAEAGSAERLGGLLGLTHLHVARLPRPAALSRIHGLALHPGPHHLAEGAAQRKAAHADAI